MNKEQLRARIKRDMLALAEKSNDNTADISYLFTKEDAININFSRQSNSGNIIQCGHSNKGYILQPSHYNKGHIFQEEHNNQGYIYQQKHSNKGKINQYSHSNNGDVNQYGHSNKGDVLQHQLSNKGNIHQINHSNEGHIHQYWHSNKGNELSSQYAIIDGKKYNAITLDDIYSVIVEDKRRNGIGVFKDMDSRYVATNGVMSYHSWKSYDHAKACLKNKKIKLMEDLGEWVKTLKPDSKITRELFHEETGSCMPGIENWCKKVGISKETKSITFKKFKELATANPTMETRKVMRVLELLKESE